MAMSTKRRLSEGTSLPAYEDTKPPARAGDREEHDEPESLEGLSKKAKREHNTYTGEKDDEQKERIDDCTPPPLNETLRTADDTTIDGNLDTMDGVEREQTPTGPDPSQATHEPSEAEVIVSKHWQYARMHSTKRTTVGKRPLLKFTSQPTDLEVLCLVFDKSVKCPNVLPAACRDETKDSHAIVALWLETVNFVFVGDVYKFRAEQERTAFHDMLVHQCWPQHHDWGSDHVLKVTIPGFSRAVPGAWVWLFEVCQNMQEIAIGIRAEEMIPDKEGADGVEEFIEKWNLDLLSGTCLKKLTVALDPTGKKGLMTSVTQVWLQRFAQHMKGLRAGKLQVFLDTTQFWDRDIPADVREM